MKYATMIILIFLPLLLNGQIKYVSETSKTSFYSKAPVEDIEAHNEHSRIILDTGKGTILAIVPVRGFIFEKPLMQEHFNDNYMESEKYPTAKFDGIIEGSDKIDFKTEEIHDVVVKGKMTIHGVTNEFHAGGKITVKDDKIEVEALFDIRLEDYDIKIPKVVVKKIAEVVKINVSAQLVLSEN